MTVGDIFKKCKIMPYYFRLFIWALIVIQLAYILMNPTSYNDTARTWFNELFVKTGIAKKVMPNQKVDNLISYQDFFSKELFDTIKKDISYSEERVAAFGYHPSVLMYNGFNCIDGYNNSYPLKLYAEIQKVDSAGTGNQSKGKRIL